MLVIFILSIPMVGWCEAVRVPGNPRAERGQVEWAGQHLRSLHQDRSPRGRGRRGPPKTAAPAQRDLPLLLRQCDGGVLQQQNQRGRGGSSLLDTKHLRK